MTDQPKLDGNYAESSATAMLAYFFLAGDRLGIAGVNAEAGVRALAGLREHAIVTDSDGGMVLDAVCHVAGLGGFDGRYRDGTADYYVSERLAPNDVKGVGPLMMAVAEARRAEVRHKSASARTMTQAQAEA